MEPTPYTATTITADEAERYPSSVVFMATHGDIVVEDRPGTETIRLRNLEGRLRRAARKQGATIRINRNGNGSIRVAAKAE